MVRWYSSIISLFLCLLFDNSYSAHIGLFASTGCYSHDTMMRHLADRLSSAEGGGHEITFIQIRVYEFNYNIQTSNLNRSHWNQLIYDGCNNESRAVLHRLQNRMWTSMIPYDSNHFDVEGLQILMQLHDHHKRACFNALRDGEFVGKLRKLRLDLLVTDYVLNECALRFSDYLDVNLAYLSNYPILSSYAVDIGISSNPSYVPSVIGYENSHMIFHRRAINWILYFLLWSTRQWFDIDVRRSFKRISKYRISKTKIGTNEFRKVLSFSTPFEMMADTPRPMARNLHYFGCDHCFNVENNYTGNALELLNITTSNNAIMLVSFGTVTKGDRIPIVQLQRLVRTFGHFPNITFIWQLDVTFQYFNQFVLRPIEYLMPSNVHIFPWIPLKRLLADPRIILLINHGGISTCFEALHHGVPILGIALQGDQGYNLQRMVERGLGEMFPVSELTEENMGAKMAMMISQIQKYRTSVSRLRAMIIDHKSLHKTTPSTFWIGWVARHFGRNRNASSAALAIQRFVALRYTSNWMVYYNLDILIISFIFIFLCTSVFCRIVKKQVCFQKQ